jgi:hypothetical protein
LGNKDYNFYFSLNIIKNDEVKVNEMSDACSTNRRDHKCIKKLLKLPENKRLFGRISPRWQDDIKMVLKTGWEVMDSIPLVQIGNCRCLL